MSTDKKGRRGIIPGIILVFLGVVFLLDNYGIDTFDFDKLWPLFLIIPGAVMLFEHYKDR